MDCTKNPTHDLDFLSHSEHVPLRMNSLSLLAEIKDFRYIVYIDLTHKEKAIQISKRARKTPFGALGLFQTNVPS